jgi:chemotaxis protein methyltransferase WspC
VSTAGIAFLLQKVIGLDEASIGSMGIHNAIRRRMKESGAPDEESFLALLKASQAEMTALIEDVVVPETWFFRQKEAFRLMRRHLTGAWQDSHPDQIPRLLSIPCSSGEEAYSMAMILQEAGLTPQGYHIDAIDISRQNLNRARRAAYGEGSFRGDDLNFRQRYFCRTGTDYALNPSLRQAVHFYQGNILDHGQMRQFGTYDIIYCRNLLIYFDRDDCKRTARLLARMLRKDGLLFVGHAETGLIWKDLFVPVHQPMTFAYRHMNDSEKALHAANPNKQNPSLSNKTKRAVTLPLNRAVRQKPANPAVASVKTSESVETDNGKAPSLKEASRLADMGELREARRLCEGYLQQQGASAQAWYLLGLIGDAQGHKEQARASFHKALYLEPDHYETLVHLALLLDRLGEGQAAQRMRKRIERVSNCRQARAVSS